MPAPTLAQTITRVTAETTALAGVTDMLQDFQAAIGEAVGVAANGVGVSAPDTATIVASVDTIMDAAVASAMSLAFALWANVPTPRPAAGQSIAGVTKDWA